MTKIWRIFWHEYKEHLTRKSYLIFTFGFPLFMLLAPLAGGIILGLAIRTALPERDHRPIGLVDQAALLTPVVNKPDGPVEIIRFSDPAQAHTALAEGRIQAVYDIQPDYWQTGQIVLDYEVAPTADIDEMVSRLIKAEVEAEVPAAILNRINRGASITHQDLSGTRSFSLENMIDLGLVFLPIYFIRLGSSFMAEYMFGSIAREAHDRTMEILITSVSPLQLVIGKLVGLLAVGLTQLGTWIGAVLLQAGGLDVVFELGILTTLFTWEHLGLMVSVVLAAYIMDQVLAAT
ncbi:MAG: ABC transporter permease, partial [Anaerolineae bacterium]|nr:ABC transporter permease [Anaerolineae bacterium]